MPRKTIAELERENAELKKQAQSNSISVKLDQVPVKSSAEYVELEYAQVSNKTGDADLAGTRLYKSPTGNRLMLMFECGDWIELDGEKLGEAVMRANFLTPLTDNEFDKLYDN